jgi:predicted ATP-grasp superfamily ATP-dependent carboligase
MDKYRFVLSDFFLFNWQKDYALDQIVNKYSMMLLAGECGLPVPLTFSSEASTPDHIKKNMKLPSIVKPLYSGGRSNDGRSQPVSRKKGKVVASRAEFYQVVSEKMFQNGYIVQEIIRGPETNLYAVGIYADINAHVIASSCGRKIRQLPKDYGIATAIDSASNETVISLAKRFVKQLHYHGPAEIEFKLSSDDGSYRFIEINPRHSGINQIFAEQGCDLAHINYLDLTGGHQLQCALKKRKVRLVSLVQDFQTIVQYRIPGVGSAPKIFLDWLKDVLKSNGDTVFSAKDPLPFLVLIAKIIMGAIASRRQRRQIA